MNRQAQNAKEVLGEAEYLRFIRLGDSIFDSISMEEKKANEGKRVAIDLKTREVRYFDGSWPSAALACAGPTWTSIVRLERIAVPRFTSH